MKSKQMVGVCWRIAFSILALEQLWTPDLIKTVIAPQKAQKVILKLPRPNMKNGWIQMLSFFSSQREVEAQLWSLKGIILQSFC